MLNSDLIISGLELMVLGMGIVFVFLMILVLALILMSRVSEYFDNPEDTQLMATPAVQPKKPDNTALIAVITAAVARYRSNHFHH